MNKITTESKESASYLLGQAIYVDDWRLPSNTLFAAVVVSPVAHGILKGINDKSALEVEGVERILTANDIPGVNQIGDILPDETLLAAHELKFKGKPVALVLANSLATARKAAAKVIVEYEALPAVFDVHEAYHNHDTFGAERTFGKGNVDKAFSESPIVIEGETYCQAQEHLYFETQVSVALPVDRHTLKLVSATQNPSAVQKFTAIVLGLPMNAIEVEVPRLGGAFGGKEEQAKPWALLAALGAYICQRPVKIVLNRQEDMQWTGKRHPYFARYRLAANEKGEIQAYEVKFLQDAGAVADLSSAVLERTLFHATNAYAIPNAKIQAVSCRTNHPSNTAFRGFGAPQAIYTLECALDHLAQKLKLPRWKLQYDNLFKAGYEFTYGTNVKNDTLRACWDHLWQGNQIAQRLEALEQHNETDTRLVKSLALTPLCFGISFTATHLNQASVTLNIYSDASVSIAISAVEMGQGVVRKMRELVARSFGIDRTLISVDFTNSSKTANMSPTAASVGTDLNGMATLKACEEIKERLLRFYCEKYQASLAEFNAKEMKISWQQLISEAYFERIDLVSHAFYSTPDIYFDRTREQGNPFAYHVYGVSAIEVTLDKILGTYQIDTVDVVYDLGLSLDHQVDLGQMEGGIVQGIGYTTIESITWNEQGDLLTNSFSTYKIPDLLSSPVVNVEFIQSDHNPYGPFSSKAIGEPPFLLGLGSYFALADAIRFVNKQAQLDYMLPLTPERALLAMLQKPGLLTGSDSNFLRG